MYGTYVNMKLRDFRNLSKVEQAEVRRRAVLACLSKPRSVVHVAREYKVSRQSLAGWVRGYKAGGEKVLRRDLRGAKKWQNASLNPWQAAAIKRAITNKTPDQFDMPFMLWNREAVGDLIQKRYGIKLGLSTISLYLERWGMTAQKPKLKCYRQQPEVVQRWLDEEYPKIKARALREGAEIHWGDETHVSSADQVGRGFSPRGKTPEVKASSRFGVNMISTVSNLGHTRFMCFSGSMNSVRFIEFLTRLIKKQVRKIYLILDNMRVHHSRKVIAWAEKHKDKITLFFLPPYAPEHNPDEYLNNTIKNRLKNHPKAQNVETLRKALVSEMKSLQNTPKIIQNLFQHEKVKYAA